MAASIPRTPTRCKTLAYASPVGRLTLAARGSSLAAVLWPDDDPRRVRLASEGEAVDDPVLVETARQLDGYFSGRRADFDLPLEFVGTDFQKCVWRALLAIPYGETRTYADVARVIGSPRAVRAVGAAIGRNPISIIAPCHRVVGSDGRLTGFAGGVGTKARLLALEADGAARQAS